MKFIHLNCDLGEGGKNDDGIIPLISACNIACGGHAGTLETMHHAVSLALEHSVQIGAHPSYPDKESFGRRTISISSEDLKRSLTAQILSLKQITEAEGGILSHIKPHGALYNEAARDETIAKLIIEVLQEFAESIPLYAPQGSVIAKLAEGKISVVCEAFADRRYQGNYQLVSRSKPNALITEKEQVFKQVYSMLQDHRLITDNNKFLACEAVTYCLHSDTPNALEILKYLQAEFRKRKVEIWKD